MSIGVLERRVRTIYAMEERSIARAIPVRAMTRWIVLVAAALLPACACSSASHELDADLVDDAGPDGSASDASIPGDDAAPPICTAHDRGHDSFAGRLTGCASDDECTDGEAGRCTRVGRAELECTYDECDSLADCPAGSLCACSVGPLDQDRCLANHCEGACGLADCDVSYGCAGPGAARYSAMAFECHTPGDECRTSADCASGQFCTRGPLTTGAPLDHWRCEAVSCAP